MGTFNSSLFLSCVLTEFHTNRRYLTIMYPKNVYEIVNHQSEYLGRVDLINSTASSTYTKYMDILSGTIFPDARTTHSDASSTNCFASYHSIMESSSNSSSKNNSLIYIELSSPTTKSPLSFYYYFLNNQQLSDTKKFSTYLTYVKGESEE